MYRISIISITAFVIALQLAIPVKAAHNLDLEKLSLDQLEQRLAYTDTELATLASYSLRSGIGPVGFRTATYADSENTEWIQIDFGEDLLIDEIVIVPVIWRDTKTGFRADGFPLEFNIIAGNANDSTGTIVASYSEQDGLLPRIAPMVISIPETNASWLRLEATRLSPRAWDGQYILELSEIMVFSGQENVALKKPIFTSTPDSEMNSRGNRFLVDGFIPYLMDAAQGNQSIAFVGRSLSGNLDSLTIDLQETYVLNRVHLHSVDLSDTVPQSTPVGFGMPKRLIVVGANNPDFSDATTLLEYVNKSVFETGPIVMRRFQEKACRYVRFIAAEPYLYYGEENNEEYRIGFAEIELFSNGRNVALGKPVSAELDPGQPERSILAITDGLNLYGKILPVREWMNELARRHDLESERPIIVAELNQRYGRQKTTLQRISWLAVLLAVAIVITILVDRILRMHQVAEIKHRFAADLHDEVGADLHTVGLLSDLAEKAKDDSKELSNLHTRIRRVTERSSNAVRNCADMLEADGLYRSMKEDMERASRRIIINLKHDISIEGEKFIEGLKQRTRVDLFLFYQECLVNISRHSGATEFVTNLKADNKKIQMTIQDNGHGLLESRNSRVPSSLKRRAGLLGATVTVETPNSGGTRINLSLKTRKWGFRK